MIGPVRRLGVLTLTAALLLSVLSACGGGDDSPDSTFTPGGASASASTTPGAGGTAGAAPKVELPPDIKLVFDYTPTGNADKDAIIRDLEVLERSIYKVIRAENRSVAPYREYATGQALGVTEDYVTGKLKTHESVTGTQRYYNFKFVAIEKGVAEVKYCFDERLFYAKSNETGHVYRTRPSLKSFSQVTIRSGKTRAGIWREEIFEVQEGSKLCQSRA